MLHFRKSILSQTLLVTGALAAVAGVASGQARRPQRDVLKSPKQLETLPGQIILYCQPGTPRAEVDRLAASVAAQVRPLLLADAYVLQLDAAHSDQMNTGLAIAKLKVENTVRGVQANVYDYPLQSSGTGVAPDDPRYKAGDQYALKLINMPLAWTLQKGSTDITVAVYDSGFDPKHEDAPKFHPLSTDIADNDGDITADGGGGSGTYDHGTAVSGVMMANTNNGKGIAGVIWNRMQCLALKGFHKGEASFARDVSINALAYMAQHAAEINLVAANFSLGNDFPPELADPSGTYNAAYQNLISKGVHCVVAAGNSAIGTRVTPADFPNVIKVSAVGPDPSKLAVYSNFNTITIAAPGGNQNGTGRLQDGVLVMNQNSAYNFEDGTSFACPHVTAALGLIRSVPGVTYDRALTALLTQANHTITGQTSVPDSKFGAGLLDVYASLVSVSNVVFITDPQGVDPSTNSSTAPNQAAPLPVESLRPLVRFRATNTKVVNNIPQISVTLTTPGGTQPLIVNGVVADSAKNLISNLYIHNISTDPNFTQFDVSFRYTSGTSVTSQQQQITVTSTPNDANFAPAQASLVFNVAPHVFPAGISMVSFPVAETAADSPDGNPRRDIKSILGTNSVILYRWINAPVVDSTGKQSVQGQYAIYGSGSADNQSQFATLHPSDVTTTPIPTIDPRDNPNDPASITTDSTPVGLGYFINLTAGAAVQSYGRTFTQQTIRVPLHEGWNMIGDPFQFPIAFANLTLQTSNGTLYAASDAATSKLILPFIYRFVGNDYEFQALPNGTLYPWEGNWIYVIPKDSTAVNPSATALTLVMTPTQAGTTRGVRKPGTASLATRASHSLGSKPEVRGPGSWALQLVARSRSMVDSHNYIGMSSTAKDEDDLTKAPKPPRFGSSVSLGLQRGTRGALYAQDLRSLGGTKIWNVVVNTDQPNVDVTLAWPDSRALPRNYQITLKDSVTGQTVDMRTRASFQFNSGPKAEAREFTITAQPGSTGDRVAFNNVVVTQRGLSKATGQSTYQIDYNLSHEAQVDVSIMNAGGRLVTQLDGGRAAGSGDNHVIWNGRDGKNQVVPAGTYLVRFRAVSSEGRVTQYHYPLTVTGR